MAVGNKFRGGKLAAVDDARMVFPVTENRVPFLGQRSERSLVGKKSRGKEDDRFPLEKCRQRFLELDVQLDRAIQQTRTGAAGSISTGRVAGRLDHPRILGQSQVVIRADHDFRLTLADHIVPVWFFNAAEVRVKTLCPRIRAIPVFPAFLV